MSRTKGSVATLLETAETIRKAKDSGQPFGLIQTLATMLQEDGRTARERILRHAFKALA